MARKRNRENLPLPTRWRYRNGTYSHMVPKGQEEHWDGRSEFKLGRSQSEAYKVWAERLYYSGSDIERIRDLADRYRLEVLPILSPKTQKSYRPAIDRLLSSFGQAIPGQSSPQSGCFYD